MGDATFKRISPRIANAWAGASASTQQRLRDRRGRGGSSQIPSLTQINFEYAKVYPNPAKQVINLAYYVNTTGDIEFDLIDQLGEPVIQQALGSTQTFAQFPTSNLSNSLYYWMLKDNDRIIKTGKVAIMK